MGITYHYASLTKQEWFSASDFGGSGKRGGLGFNLTAHLFELLLISDVGVRSDQRLRVDVGGWAGDSIAIIGDSNDQWLEYKARFTDLYADLIPMIYRNDGFAPLGDLAADDDRLYVQICHLIFSRQALDLEFNMRERFGPNFGRRYKDALPKLYPFQQPKDLMGRDGT